MPKRPSEAQLGVALRSMDLEPYVYRPPDPKTGAGVSNWKPCDFMVWWRMGAADSDYFTPAVLPAWVEAKDTDAVDHFPRSDLRPSQVNGIREAKRLGIPYLLCIYWRKARRWTISNGVDVLDWFERETPATSIPRTLLMSRYGVDSSPGNLSQTIRVVLEEGW